MKRSFLFAGLIAFIVSVLVAAPERVIERVQSTGGKVVIWPGGGVLAAPDKINLPFGIVVETNGTFTVKGGKVRALEEGDVLGADGRLIRPDGSIALVIDHVTLNRGRVLVFKDGEAMEPHEAVQLADGTTVLPDRTITFRSGSSRKLLDGELFLIDGGAMPARDSITMQNGRVMVQKDGSMLAVDPARSITMNEGTKVSGDGTIVNFNGDRETLSEGQILIVQGVVRLR